MTAIMCRAPVLLAAIAIVPRGPAVAQQPAAGTVFCRPEAAGVNGYVVERIAGRLYCVARNGTMTVFLATEAGVVAVDAPPALMDVYLTAIREVTPAPVTHLVYSHSHLDHIGGASGMPAGAARIAHEETGRTLARRNDPRRPLPTRTFAVADTLRVGGEMLVLHYHGPNHDLGQLLVWAPRERVLIGVDLFNGNAPWFRLAGAKDAPGYLAVHDSVLAYDFEVFVGGHGPGTATRRDLELQRDYLRDVAAAADSAAATTSYDATTADLRPDAHGYERMAKFFRAQIAACARRTLARWGGRLPGVEVTTPSQCEALLASRRVD